MLLLLSPSMSVCHAYLGVFSSHPRLRARFLFLEPLRALYTCVHWGSALLPCGEWALALALRFASNGCAFRFCVSDPLLGVPDGNATNNQPTQGPRHYDTLTTKLFYGNLLSQNLEDYAAALPVFEEVAEG